MVHTVQDFEKLGVFYLGRRYDLSKNSPTDELLLYDSRDLLTHAVAIGMTGSGKTGLCLGLIEEAAIDGIPVIAIDPKGDISNLLLTFPELSQQSLLPWINEEEAERSGMTAEQFAQRQAQNWRQGLQDFYQDEARIKRLKDSCDFAIYTPGSDAGLPISILGSLTAPPKAVQDDGEAFRERVSATVSPLLSLLKIDGDPVMSREHILLSTVIDKAWRNSQDLDLADLVHMIQKPPVQQIGAMDVDSFFPAKERFAFALMLNNLLAAPGFSAWLEGEPMAIDRLLHTSSGKPRVSIFSIAHLNDSERMFFVTLLLSQMVAWMRTQSGTSSLRAILYMDEIFGFFPPVSVPPSKKPLLTLLKQARAFGLGIILATQNPVDLDYKGLSNTGTWFIGRLQTERDKMRVLEGLQGAAAETGSNFDNKKIERTLSALTRRLFLINNSRSNSQDIFQTRCTLSYLPGPLNKQQISKLMEGKKQEAAQSLAPGSSQSSCASATAATNAQSKSTTPAESSATPASALADMPALPPQVPAYFLPLALPGPPPVYKALLFAQASLRFVDSKANLDQTVTRSFTCEVVDGPQTITWGQAREEKLLSDKLVTQAPAPGSFMAPPPPLTRAPNYKLWAKDLAVWLSSSQKFYLLRSPSTHELSSPGQSERDFRIRLNEACVQARDREVEALRSKYAPKVNTLQDKLTAARQRLSREIDEVKEAEMQATVSIGATILGAFAGRHVLSRSTVDHASGAAKGVSKVQKQKQDVVRAQESVEILSQRFQDLQDQFSKELAQLRDKYKNSEEPLETVSFNSRRANINVTLLCLVWAPFKIEGDKWLPLW